MPLRQGLGLMRVLFRAAARSSTAAVARLMLMPVRKVSGLAMRAPKTAIATAPPIWRKVLKTALAVPARSGGTPSRTTLVMDGIAKDPGLCRLTAVWGALAGPCLHREAHDRLEPPA